LYPANFLLLDFQKIVKVEQQLYRLSKTASHSKMQAITTPTSLQNSINATKVEYVQLGTSGLRVSSPILGTMGIGSKAWQNWAMEEEEGLQLLKAAWDRGTYLYRNIKTSE